MPPSKIALPTNLENIREAARRAISPVAPMEVGEEDYVFSWYGKRTDAGWQLPEYYLVFFLLVELLGFRNLRQDEKVAWSIPITFEGKIYSIAHRKMGLGLFVPNAKANETQAQKIVSLVNKAVSVAEPYFEWLAEQAAQGSSLNVTNNGASLFERYEFLRDEYRALAAEAEARKDESHTEPTSDGLGTITRMPSYELKIRAGWMALAATEAFFSWTEHIFIHLAILDGRLTTGREVAELAKELWKIKFKRVVDLSDPDMKVLFDDLLIIRNEMRNFITHGSFGKRGEAFRFHSAAGAVPVMLTERSARQRYSMSGAIPLSDDAAIATIEKFIIKLWSGAREPARIYIQESDLPLILTMAKDGTYAAAMRSNDDMRDFVDHLSRSFDNAANMDW